MLIGCVTIVLMLTMTLPAQEAAFTVASIKPNTSGLPYSQSADRPDGVAFVNERLRDVMLFAFGLHDFQLAGAQIGRASCRERV